MLMNRPKCIHQSPMLMPIGLAHYHLDVLSLYSKRQSPARINRQIVGVHDKCSFDNSRCNVLWPLEYNVLPSCVPDRDLPS